MRPAVAATEFLYAHEYAEKRLLWYGRQRTDHRKRHAACRYSARRISTKLL